MRWLTRSLSLLALVASTAILMPARTADEAPMTEEDVVRLFAAGRPTEEIVGEIERRPAGYELSPEMLEELRNVDLPESVIEAMQRRLRERRRLEAEREAAAPNASRPILTLHLNRDRGGGISVGIRASVDPQRAALWELGNAPEDRVHGDLALFVACLTPDHVPDQWRLLSPLGRDFESAPRHRMLEFVSGVQGEGQSESGSNIKLVTGPALELALEPGVVHELLLGLAVQVGGSYRIVASDSRKDVLLEETGLELDARVRGGSLRWFKVKFGLEDEDDDEGEEEPSSGWDTDEDEETDAPPTDQPSSSETSVETPGSSMVTP